MGDLYAILQREAPVTPLPIVGDETRPPQGTAYCPQPVEKPAPKEQKTWADIAKMLGPIEWDWQGWLAKGFLCILAGASGMGKSILALRIAACYIMGWCWPDGTPFTGEKGKVLWVEAENAEALNNERATAWGLPLECIITYSVEDPLAGVDLDNAEHRDAIITAARRADVKLIIVDSLSAASSSRDENSSAMLKITRWLAALAKETGKPVLLTHHLRKAGMGDPQGPTLERLRGHSSIVQCSRLVWSLHKPDAEKATLCLSVIKSNLAKFPQAVGMAIDDEGRVSFGAAPMKAKELSETEKAAAFLKEALAKGPVKQADILEEAKLEGISYASLRRAKADLGVSSHKSTLGWLWSLPPKEKENEHLEHLEHVEHVEHLEHVGSLQGAQGAQGAQENKMLNEHVDGQGDDPFPESLFTIGGSDL